LRNARLRLRGRREDASQTGPGGARLSQHLRCECRSQQDRRPLYCRFALCTGMHLARAGAASHAVLAPRPQRPLAPLVRRDCHALPQQRAEPAGHVPRFLASRRHSALLSAPHAWGVMGCDCLIRVEGTISKVLGRDVGIYVSREHQHKLAPLLGRRVTVLLTAPRPEGRGSAPSGASSHRSGAPHGRGIMLRPRRQPRGGAGSSPAKLARAQLQARWSRNL
jgi:hypothetical protein